MSVLVQKLGLSSTGNRATWTFSAWVKRSRNVGSSSEFIFSSNTERTGGGQYSSIFFENDSLRYYDYYSGTSQKYLTTNRKFRDVSGWYHIVVRVDTTQSTASDRIRFYVNGVQETSFANSAYPVQNDNSSFVNWAGADNFVGTQTNNLSGHFLGTLSHVHLADGQSYAPTVFGSTDATTGEWKINTNPTVSYGTNGFFLFKNDNVITDRSGQGNNFSIGSGTLTLSQDNPSNVFATLNPLDNFYGNSSLSNGNNTQNQSASSNNYAFIPATLGFNSGKWYWEMKCVSGHSDNWYGVGITSTQCTADNNWLGQTANSYSLYGYSYGGGLGASYTGGTRINQGLSFTAGDIIGCAVDCDNLAIYFSKNGTWMSNASSVQGVPTSGSSKTGSFYTLAAPSSITYQGYGGFYLPAVCYYDARTAVQNVNFGNGYFGTSAVSSAGTNASNNGIFEYDVPAGYTALSTKGLNL